MVALIPFMVLVAGIPVVNADQITFTGSGSNAGGNLEASALFFFNGDELILTLTNTATNDNNSAGKDISANTLSGVFFDIGGNPVLAPLSAWVAPGSQLIQPGACSPGPCTNGTSNVGGEWYFSDWDETALAAFGIASSGYIGGSNPTFGGPNLDDPANSGNGINFGIVSNDPSFNPNGGLANDPLIQNSVVFTFSGASGVSIGDISNVSFQYGTDLVEPNITSTPGEPIPEPATMALVTTGFAGLAAWRWRSRRQSGNS